MDGAERTGDGDRNDDNSPSDDAHDRVPTRTYLLLGHLLLPPLLVLPGLLLRVLVLARRLSPPGVGRLLQQLFQHVAQGCVGVHKQAIA